MCREDYLSDGAIQILNSELATVAECFDSNKLAPNINKTQMLMVSGKKYLNPQGDVILRNEVIQRSMVSHKISKSCGIISRIRNTLDIKSKKNYLL